MEFILDYNLGDLVILRRAVERAMIALYARCNLVPATAAGYEMVRNEIACALGDLRNGAVHVEAQPPGFRVAWNGVDCTWLGMKTTATGPERYDATQRPLRTASVGIVDQAPNPRCTIRRESPLRADGFSQAAIDAVKAALLAPAKKRGSK